VKTNLLALSFVLILTAVIHESAADGPARRRAVNPHPTPAPTPTPVPQTFKPFKDQVFAGYQGWFSAAGDKAYDQWIHWSPYPNVPAPGRVTFELYPDVREYDQEDLFYTDLGRLSDGTASQLFSSHRTGVVDLHFRWMKEYGIDGAALQRFVVATVDENDLTQLDRVAGFVKTSAEKYGRSFYIEYDLSGFTGNHDGELVEHIKRDFTENVEGKLQLPDSPAYARQDGKPVVEIWGLSFGHTKVFTPELARELIQWFQSKGYYVIGGVPYDWGNVKNGWQDVYLLFNMIQPWAVGAHPSDNSLKYASKNETINDKHYCDRHGIDYQMVIYPGFAWSNWNGGPRNVIARYGGSFFWHQAYYARKLGMKNAFIAMFDEYDEGTAIAKAAENESMLPKIDPGKSSKEAPNQYFLTLDADGQSLSSDFYLRLAGEATRMIHGERELTFDVPIPKR